MALREFLRRTTLLDRIVVLVIFAASLAGIAWAATAPGGERLVVERDGRVIFTAPLASERTVVLPGPLGETVLAVSGGRVRVIDSPCRNKVCLGMGEIVRSGEVVACVPNRLLVRIDGGGAREEEAYDLLGH